MKKKYRNLSLVIHPDKFNNETEKERAKEAFNILKQANETLADPEKRKIYIRIMREARERTEYERTKENKKREKLG